MVTSLQKARSRARDYDVICVGSSTVDVFAHTEANVVKIKTAISEEELIAYPVGSKILIRDLHFEVGGGGTNTAVAFARLGLKTGYLGNVGSDQNSNHILEVLSKEGISFAGQREGLAGYSVILDSIDEDRTILTFKGANDHLTLSPIRIKALMPSWFYCSSMMGQSFDTLCKIARHAKAKKIKLAFNPSAYQAGLGVKALRPILASTTILAFNKEEAQLMLGKPTTSIPALMHELHRFRIPYIAITDGKTGSYVSDKRQILFSPPGKLKVVETTGAGDGFASAFVAGIMQGESLEICLRMGMIEAEQVVTHLGAKTALLSRNAMDKALRSDKHKIVHIH